MRNRILVLEHAADEGTGAMGPFLKQAGFALETIRLHDGDKIPANALSMHAIISMGGPMGAYEDEKYPFLKAESEMLRKAIWSGMPVLGICLGAQMIAKSAGARVYRAPQREIGWHSINMEPDAESDILFSGTGKELLVFQFHEDTFDLPPSAVRLANSRRCRNQAFRVCNAYGLQFHVEMTMEMIEAWFRDRAFDRTRLCDEYLRFGPVLKKQNEVLFRNMLRLLKTGVFHEQS